MDDTLSVSFAYGEKANHFYVDQAQLLQIQFNRWHGDSYLSLQFIQVSLLHPADQPDRCRFTV